MGPEQAAEIAVAAVLIALSAYGAACARSAMRGVERLHGSIDFLALLVGRGQSAPPVRPAVEPIGAESAAPVRQRDEE